MGPKEGNGTGKTMLSPGVAWKCQAWENWLFPSGVYSLRQEVSQRKLLSSGVSENSGDATWSRVLEGLAPLAPRQILPVASQGDRGICRRPIWGLREARDAREKRYSVDEACPKGYQCIARCSGLRRDLWRASGGCLIQHATKNSFFPKCILTFFILPSSRCASRSTAICTCLRRGLSKRQVRFRLTRRKPDFVSRSAKLWNRLHPYISDVHTISIFWESLEVSWNSIFPDFAWPLPRTLITLMYGKEVIVIRFGHLGV